MPILGVIHEFNVETIARDGVVLRSTVFRPDAPGRFPAILCRSPYGTIVAGLEYLVRAGYAVVAQDARGRYTSDGDFILFSEEETNDGTDGADTLAWMLRQPWCDGRLSMMGDSYGGYLTWATARLAPVGLRAVSARTIPRELRDVDYRQGIFCPARRIHWWLNTIAPDMRKRAGLGPPHTPAEARALWQTEQARWLQFMPWKEFPDFLPPRLAASARQWFSHPERDIWHFAEMYPKITVPNFDVTGWYDHCNGSIDHHAGLQQQGGSEDARRGSRLIIGPWNHPQRGQRQIGDIDFGPSAQVDLGALYVRWFDRWVKGLPNGVDEEPPVQYFEIGTGRWLSADRWPPEPVAQRQFFLGGHADPISMDSTGELRPEPAETGEPHAWTSDPRDPVPTLWGPDLFTVPADRRRLDHRRDLLRYLSLVLTEDIHVAGSPEAVLWLSSSAVDTDLFVHLADDDPAGPATELCYGFIRARYRHGLEAPALLAPGQLVELRLTLMPIACCFRRGHRLRLEIAASNFPCHDRNHHTGGDDLAETRLLTAHLAIHHGTAHPSRLQLPIAPP